MSTSFIRDRPYLAKERASDITMPKLVICPLCGGFLWRPIACTTCETPFCKSCIKNWKAERTEPIPCPENCTEFIERKCPAGYLYALSELKLTCLNKSHGCNETLPYNNLETHEESCNYRLKTCPGCRTEIIRMEFDEHCAQCPLFLLTCPECNTSYQRQYAGEHNDTVCLRIQLRQLQDNHTQHQQEANERITPLEDQIRSLRQLVESLKNVQIDTQ
ncbi:unnamed protein product [Adineta ricciae]|uniref:Uncharacterized protein n=1 Tax=Adineta ricciae TaxID=249248 RepID=A0A814FMQ2_ADIRI|nr:unnamed protein product [Adineta ricciae]